MSIIVSHTVMFELTIQRNVINNTDETKEEQEGVSSQVDTVSLLCPDDSFSLKPFN